MLFVQNLINLFLDEGHASEEPSDQSQTTDENSEIGSIEDGDSIGIVGNAEFFKGWVIESVTSVLKHLKLDPEAKFQLQKMCIEQLQSLLANAQKVEEPLSLANGLEPNDLGCYFMRFFSTLRNIPSVSLFRTLNDEDEQAVKKLQEMENKLYKEERNCGLSSDANKLHALSDATPKLMDVLVDTLLSLLPQSSAPMHSAIEQVFRYFSADVTDDGLLCMLLIIKKDLKPSRHQEAGSEDDDADDDDLLGIEEDEDIDEAETGETAESDEQSEDPEALVGSEGADKELPEDSDDSDGGMDDDATFRMDTYLAQIFKEKKNQAGGETAQSQLVLFKLRVLSLLEIYLHENRGKCLLL
ncbi:hypothetical protein CRYUN_Cryun04dG0070100 [Craigia yunnanensis]